MLVKQLKKFQLDGFYPYVTELNYSVETGQKLGTILPTIDATVPGSVYNDLLQAGFIDDPYYEMNSMKCEWVKDRWWRYKTEFTIDKKNKGKILILTLGGIDYKAHIFINGNKLGVHEGMYVPFKSNITKLINYETANLLEIVLESAPDEMGQIGYTEQTYTQKARFGYKWDWSVRMINLGLYEAVTIDAYDSASIEFTQYTTQVNQDSCDVYANIELMGYEKAKIEVQTIIKFGDEEVDRKTREIDIKKQESLICSYNLVIDKPNLWWPAGHGKQPLYDVITQVYVNGKLSDEKQERIGIRTVEYLRCENASNDSLPYNIVINGKQIYIKGVNTTPLDMMYGSIPDWRYEQLLRGALDANINVVRIWGGGLIEPEIFYNLCDEYGLLIWQEFIQSSSGINNVPSKRKEFLFLLSRTATQAVKTKRNHPSLIFWSGGNELTFSDGTPVNYTDENIAMLLEIVKQHDPSTYMLPSSASGPLEFLDINKPGQNHDVHGPWKYGGIVKHYNLFNKSDSMLHSEFGVDGMSNRQVLDSILSPANRKVFSMEENFVWRHHGEWWDTFERDSSIFGEFDKDELNTFIKCSQFIQAEGLRYALEANRRRAFQSAGSLIWQFNESWPNVSGTNVFDWYGGKKLGYYYLRDAYRQVNINMRYDKLVFSESEEVIADIFISNDDCEFDGQVVISISDTDENVIYSKDKTVTINAKTTTQVTRVRFDMLKGGAFIDLSLNSSKCNVCSRYLLFCNQSNNTIDKKLTCDHYDWYIKNRT